MPNRNKLKTEKLIYRSFLIAAFIFVNIFIGYFAYAQAGKNLQIAVSNVAGLLNKNIENNKNIATALGNTIPLSNDAIRTQLGVDIDKEFHASNSQDYESHLMFLPKEISYEDARISMVINAFWKRLSDENKSSYWTYFTRPDRKYYFCMNEQQFMHFKNKSPHLFIKDYLKRLQQKLNSDKGFLVSDVFYSNVYSDALTGLPTITVGSPVITDNQSIKDSKIAGMIVTDFTLNDLNDIFERVFLSDGDNIATYRIRIKSHLGNDALMQVENKRNRRFFLPDINIKMTDGYYVSASTGVWDIISLAKWAFLFTNLFLLMFAVAFCQSSRKTRQAMDKLSYDSLTNALSREGGDAIINTLSHHQKMMLIVADLNDFKTINDTYGHHVGDLALIYFVETLNGILSASDKIIRMGGDEFLILLPDCDYETVDILMQRAQSQFDYFSYNGTAIPISCAYGVQALTGVFSEDYQRADEKLYEMKRKRAEASLNGKTNEWSGDLAPVDGSLLTLAEIRQHPECFQKRSVLALIHLSNHSSLNNLLGVGYGRALMEYLISRLKEALPEGILLCRERPDKLLVVFPPLQTAEQLPIWKRQLESLFTLQEVAHSDNHELRISGNAGIVEEPILPERFDDIVLNAGIALHHVRNRIGNGGVAWFTPEMQQDGLRQIQLHEQISLALERDEFHLVMQPIVELGQENQCREGECLIRWQSPVLGFVPPDKFISLAEETGLIIPLGEWIIHQACKQLSAFIARGAPGDFKLHINVSPLQLQQKNFSSSVLENLNRYALQGKNICIEITEGVMLESGEHIIKQLTLLQQAGVTIALDDFGSGYSSLSYLHALPFDQLKIDREFVNGMLTDSRSESVVASVVNLSRVFDVPLVAEGIENKETEEKLRSMGCQLAQGYFYGRPQPFLSWKYQDGLISC
ncbi:EAL domain-containing protein [Enterobacteriaceae bacterium RIT691]|nr:EAL domain-containing protein [Enterobacteriaceae bacterium RIT691]